MTLCEILSGKTILK